MNFRLTLIASVLSLAGVAAMADPVASEPVSRASVKASVLAARAAHQLLPAGEAAEYAVKSNTSTTSTVTRAEIKNEVREARAHGELIPAGEAESYEVAHGPLTWDRSRAEVKADVIEARAHGELIPAGEGQRLDNGNPAAGSQTIHRLAGGLRKLRNAQ